jgi:hypothetical protein
VLEPTNPFGSSPYSYEFMYPYTGSALGLGIAIAIGMDSAHRYSGVAFRTTVHICLGSDTDTEPDADSVKPNAFSVQSTRLVGQQVHAPVRLAPSP